VDTRTEWPLLRILTYCSILLGIGCALGFPAGVCGQQDSGPLNILNNRGPGEGGLNNIVETGNVEVYIQQPSGAPVEGVAVVTLMNLSGQVYRQTTTKTGFVSFNNVAPTEYKIQVVSPAYERAVKQVDASRKSSAKVTIVLTVPEGGLDVATANSLAALKPKAQKEVVKAMEALRDNKPDVARGHLESVNRMAPNQAEVRYLFGVYSSELKDWTKAKEYWTQTLALNPRHVRALVSLAETSIQEKKPSEAMEYSTRAVEADAASWRAHALRAEASLLLGERDECVKEAERAMELGRGQAAILQPLLARALAERGDKERALALLEGYVRDHPTDVAAKKDLEILRAPPVAGASGSGSAATREDLNAAALNETVLATMGRSTWMPPDIDESIPPVETGATCQLDEIVRNAGARMQELIRNVDRFAATEAVTHETINKKGLASDAETAKFDYMVSIEALRSGFLNVEEYRTIRYSSPGFPASVMTNGLPAMVLAFHPRFANNYEMSCEGLARSSGQLAWQVHFLQRRDRPNELRSYKLGGDGPSYAVAVKGRAWLSAESYQILRMETDLVAPMPEIRLAADHIAVEYGPVHFKSGALDMWLPQTADVFYQWRGQRVHRRHSFSHYLLFSVDDKQRISAPKGGRELPPESDKPR
jgi:tetratricopeptide (TPR) repeat protein